MNSILITDLDFTLVTTVTPATRPSANNWKLNIPLDYLRQYDSVYIVTNQADKRYNTKYAHDVVKHLSKSYKNPIILIINDKIDIYRKPHVMTFLNKIKPHISETTNITWIGDQISDYKYYCNCLLHLDSPYKGKYLYFDIKDLKTPIKPTFITTVFINSKITFNPGTTVLIHMYLLDLKSAFLTEHKSFQIDKEYKTHYLLLDEKHNIKILLGRFTDTTKYKFDDEYILNTEADTIRIARYFEYTIYKPCIEWRISDYYKKVNTKKIIHLYPNVDADPKQELLFREL